MFGCLGRGPYFDPKNYQDVSYREIEEIPLKYRIVETPKGFCIEAYIQNIGAIHGPGEDGNFLFWYRKPEYVWIRRQPLTYPVRKLPPEGIFDHYYETMERAEEFLTKYKTKNSTIKEIPA